MKNLLILAVIAFSSVLCNGQYSIRAFNFRPTGNFGSVMKPAYAFEIGKSDYFSESRIRSSVAANFMIFQPRLDTFPSYGSVYDGVEGLQVRPGYEVVGNYIMLNGYFGGDWSPVSFGDFYPYFGGDIQVGVYRYKDESYAEGISHQTKSILGVLFGLRARIGIEYEYSQDFSFFLNLNRQGWFNVEPRFLAFGWDLGLGVKYAF